MKLNLKPENTAEAIREAEKRCTVRTITPEEIRNVLEEVDEHLAMFSTKKDAIGTVVEIDLNAQTFPGAYKGTPESTQFTARLTSGGWRVEWIGRLRVKSPSNRIKLTLTEATKTRMLEHLSRIK